MSDEVNREFYGRAAPGANDYWRKMAAPRFRVATILELLAQQPPQTLCDLGCGGGQLLAEVRDRFPAARLCGIDLSPAQIEHNRGLHPGIRWLARDLDEAIELPDELADSCDAVVAMELIEHVVEPQRLLESARRLVRPGGRLILSTQSGPLRETERRVGHRRHFTAEQMRACLVEAGWRPLRVWNSGFPFHDLSKWYANRDPDASLARFADRAYGLREDLVCLGLRLLFQLNSRRRGAQLFAVADRPG